MHRSYLPGLLYRFLEEEDPQEECHLIISGYLRKAAPAVPRQYYDREFPPPPYLGIPTWLAGVSVPYAHYAIVALVTFDRFDYYVCRTKLHKLPEPFYLTTACYFGNLRLVKQVIAREGEATSFQASPTLEISRLASVDAGFYHVMKAVCDPLGRDIYSVGIPVLACRILLSRDDPEILKAAAHEIKMSPRFLIDTCVSATGLPQGPNLSAI